MKNVNRILIGFVGWAVLLLGVVMIPYPGPGWIVVFIGLSILAREFHWARRLNDRARHKYESWKSWLGIQPSYIKALFFALTTMTVIVTVWLLNGYGMMNEWFNLGIDWVRSPLLGE